MSEDQPRWRAPFQFDPYAPPPVSPPTPASVLSAAERHRATDRRYILSEMMENNASRNVSGLQIRTRGLSPVQHRVESTRSPAAGRGSRSHSDFPREVVGRHFSSSTHAEPTNISSFVDYSFLPQWQLNAHPDTSNGGPSDVPSSSEAAALFASGPASSTPTPNSLSSVLRHRRAMLFSDLNGPRTESTVRSQSPSMDAPERITRPNYRSPVDPLDIFRSPSPPSDDEPVITQRRRSPVRPTGSSIRERILSLENDLAQHRSAHDALLARDGRERTRLPPFRSALGSNGHSIFARDGDGEVESRPPSLPPFRFERDPLPPLDFERGSGRLTMDRDVDRDSQVCTGSSRCVNELRFSRILTKMLVGSV